MPTADTAGLLETAGGRWTRRVRHHHYANSARGLAKDVSQETEEQASEVKLSLDAGDKKLQVESAFKFSAPLTKYKPGTDFLRK